MDNNKKRKKNNYKPIKDISGYDSENSIIDEDNKIIHNNNEHYKNKKK